MRAAHYVGLFTTGLRAFTATEPVATAADFLETGSSSLVQLIRLCIDRHDQRLLWSFRVHEATLEMLDILTDIEATQANVRRLPPVQLRQLREHAFDLLAAFCHGFERNQEALFPSFSKVVCHVTTHHSPLTTRHPLLPSHYSPLTTRHPLLPTHYSPLTTRHPLLTTHYSLLTTRHPLPTTHYSLITTH